MIAALCIVIGLVFLLSIVLDPHSRRNLLYRMFGYVGYAVPLVALGSGVLLLVVRERTLVNRVVSSMTLMVVLASHAFTAVGLLATSASEAVPLSDLPGGLVGGVAFACFRLFAPHHIAVPLQAIALSCGVALVCGRYVHSLVASCTSRYGKQQPSE
jgi:ABC-type Fe3+ transport system permease subunit